MGLFGKKPKKEEPEDFEKESEGGVEKRSLKRKSFKDKEFKDLNPSDRKQRKEPKKPWGRYERFTVLFVFLFTAGVSGYLALSARDWKLPGLPRLTANEIKLTKILGEETIVIEGNGDNVRKADEVKKEFREATRNLSGVYGLYVGRLEDGTNYGINDKETFQAASVIKLPVMAALYEEVEAGSLKLDTRYKLKDSDRVPGAGSLYTKPTGYEITYGNLLKLMGKQSDNTAFKIVRNLLGDEKIKLTINKVGMKNTSLEKNETTPQDIGMFYEELWNGNVVNKKNKEEFLSFLTDTAYEDWLPQGLPDGVRIAHKVGIEVHVINDAGIVYAKNLSGPVGSPSMRPYVVVILTKGVVEKEAKEVLPKLSKIIYDIEMGSN